MVWLTWSSQPKAASKSAGIQEILWSRRSARATKCRPRTGQTDKGSDTANPRVDPRRVEHRRDAARLVLAAVRSARIQSPIATKCNHGGLYHVQRKPPAGARARRPCKSVAS